MTETQEQQALELAVKTVRDYASRIKFAFGANSDAILLDSMEIVCLAALRASQVQTETTPDKWKAAAIALYHANERWGLTSARREARDLLQAALNTEADLAVRQSSPRSQPVVDLTVDERNAIYEATGGDNEKYAAGIEASIRAKESVLQSPRSQPVTAKEETLRQLHDAQTRLQTVELHLDRLYSIFDCYAIPHAPYQAVKARIQRMYRAWNVPGADTSLEPLDSSAQPVTSASIEEAKDKVLRCLDKAFWGRTDAQAAKQWEQAVADLEALITAVRQDEHEKHGETVIAYEGEGIAPDDVTDGYSYSAEVVRRKITAVRQGCAEKAESTLAALPQEIDSVIIGASVIDSGRNDWDAAISTVRDRLRSFWREKGL